MLSQYVNNIEGVYLYAILGFLIFFILFIMVTIHALKMDKEKISQISNLPLEGGVENND